MERKKLFIQKENAQMDRQLIAQLQLAEGIMSQVEIYAHNHKSLSTVSELHRVFARFKENVQIPFVVQGKSTATIFHHAFNDLLYLLNDNHDPNTDPSGFIHKGNACRLLVMSPDLAEIKKRASYQNMNQLVEDLSADVPTADIYPALYYDVNEAPHLMVQRVGIAQLHTRVRDFDFAFTGIQQTMQWGNDETHLSFHVVQEEKQGVRVDKPVEINPYIFTKHYPGKISTHLP